MTKRSRGNLARLEEAPIPIDIVSRTSPRALLLWATFDAAAGHEYFDRLVAPDRRGRLILQSDAASGR